MPGYAFSQPQMFPGRVLHIAGSRVLTAPKNQALPSFAKVEQGAEPSGYLDHGSIAAALVELSVEITRQSIDLGKIATPKRFYLESQRGNFRFDMQEYQPETIDIAAGTALGEPQDFTTYQLINIGGQIPPDRRVLVLDDFDVDPALDASEVWDQYWWTNPNASPGSTFTRKANKAATDIPMQIDLLAFDPDSSGVNRLVQFIAIAA